MKEYVGSGCLISPFIILTCAHNVFSNKYREYYGEILVKAGEQDSVAVIGYRINE
jgi:hypothetical protein